MRNTWLAGCLFGFALTASGFDAKTVKLTSKFLEYQDKVQDAELEISIFQALMRNLQIDQDQLRDDCEFTKSLVKKGFEQLNVLRACENAMKEAELKTAAQESALRTLERNRDIWTIRLASEAGDAISVKDLAELYTSKWRRALALADSQVAVAKLRYDVALEYQEWAKRVRLKGYLKESDYNKALNAVATTRNDWEAHKVRQQKIADALTTTEAGLARLQTEPNTGR